MSFKITNIKPDCLNDVDLSNTLTNKVYNIYKCKKCILEHKFDKIDRKKRKYVKIFPNDLNKKPYSLHGCKHQTILLIKYKRCDCGIETFGTRILGNRKCYECDVNVRKPSSDYKEYYRIKIFCILSKTNLNDPNKWDCKFRSYCLESTFHEGACKGLACKNCRFYTKDIL